MQQALSVLPRPLTTHEIPFIHQMASRSHPKAEATSRSARTYSFERDVRIPRLCFCRKNSS